MKTLELSVVNRLLDPLGAILTAEVARKPADYRFDSEAQAHPRLFTSNISSPNSMAAVIIRIISLGAASAAISTKARILVDSIL